MHGGSLGCGEERERQRDVVQDVVLGMPLGGVEQTVSTVSQYHRQRRRRYGRIRRTRRVKGKGET